MDFVSNAPPLSSKGFEAALATTDVAGEALWALLSVETSGCGYLPDRRPKILFERHIFSRLTDGRYDADNPDVSAPTPGGYGAGGAHQYDRLAVALHLDEQAALQSASWGLGQIMGENFAAADFASVGEMVQSFVESEDAQLSGMANFLASGRMKALLQAQDWAGFARLYNGVSYAKNHYDERLEMFHDRFVAHGSPDLDIRAAQIYLGYRDYDTGGVDGIIGPKTTAALTTFQGLNGLPQTGVVDADTLAALASPA